MSNLVLNKETSYLLRNNWSPFRQKTLHEIMLILFKANTDSFRLIEVNIISLIDGFNPQHILNVKKDKDNGRSKLGISRLNVWMYLHMHVFEYVCWYLYITYFT